MGLIEARETKERSQFCADDSHSGGQTSSFLDAIAEVGEDSEWFGTGYESWAEIPQERLKLLGLVQKSINDGNAKAAARRNERRDEDSEG